MRILQPSIFLDMKTQKIQSSQEINDFLFRLFSTFVLRHWNSREFSLYYVLYSIGMNALQSKMQI